MVLHLRNKDDDDDDVDEYDVDDDDDKQPASPALQHPCTWKALTLIPAFFSFFLITSSSSDTIWSATKSTCLPPYGGVVVGWVVGKLDGL